jgi:hypothetical protein
MSVFQNLPPEVIPRQKYPRSVGLNLTSNGIMLIETTCCSFSVQLCTEIDVDVFEETPPYY